MADYTIVLPPGEQTFTASADVVGGQVVEVTVAESVGPAAAGSLKVVGQALYDAKAGQQVTVYGDGAIREAKAVGAIAVGARLKAGTAGGVATYVDGTDAATLVIGKAITAAADGATVKYQSV